jgi:hypothetical protein
LNSIAFEFSPLWLLPVFLFAAGITWLLYSNKREYQHFSKNKRWFLGILRFLVLSLIGILLLSPFIKSSTKDIKKPLILIAEDVSESISAVSDSSVIKEYRENLERLKDKLSSNFVVEHRQFSNELGSIDSQIVSGKSTNISSVFEKAYNELGAENLSSIILISDGIHNEGADPAWTLERLKVPVYAAMLGDTMRKKDLKISTIFYNKIAYLNDRFTVQVDVSAFNCQQQSTTLRVYNQAGRVLQQVQIDIESNDFFKTVPITIDAKPEGIQRFRFQLSPLENESNLVNNSRDIYVDVLDARQKVLILAHSPHPDIATMRQILEMNQNYQVTVQMASAFSSSLKDYDLVILHQLPSTRFNNSTWIKELNDKRIPRLFIVGPQTDFPQFNQWQSALNIKQGSAGNNEVQAYLNPIFNLFTVENNLIEALREFNPMSAPFGDYKAGADANVMLFQKIGKIETDFPLLLFQNNSFGKTGVLAAEGIWKWKFFDYMQRENSANVTELIQKSITFLSTKEDKRRFKAFSSRNIFDENEPISLQAELYNQSYQLINEPDAYITIIDENKKEFNFTFNKKSNSYSLSPGLFPPGNYTFKANTKFDGENLTSNGQFSIQAVEKELFDLTANHGLLERLALMYGGKAIYPNQLETLSEELNSNNKIRPVIYESFKTLKGIDLKWIFFLIAILLFVEWFFRKYFGSY